LKTLKITKIPKSKPKSPTRFTIKAFIAALLACILVNQKLIKRYEHKPTPSHPKNNCMKLFAVISISIKKVKKEIYAIKRFK